MAAMLLSIIAWAAFAIAAPADPTITSPPILPRQADAAFIGWVSYNSTWVSETCNSGLTWYQSGNYAQCCPDTSTGCSAPTACAGGSQIYPLPTETATIACTENYNDDATNSICNTVFIYENFGDSSPKTDIVCGDSSVVWSFYRQIPATSTSSATSSNSSDNSQEHKSSSKAWIAGAVAGPIVGIALIAGIIFFLIRRKNKKNKQTNILPQTGGATMGPPPGVAPYSNAKPQMSQNTASVYYGQPSPGLSDPYNQQGFSQSLGSPAPQYSAPGSPPPQGVFAPEVNYGYNAQSHTEASELGDTGSATTASVPGQSHSVELPGEQIRT
ncbi:hypothetical protein P280DRAFT_508550 [Massarina eburnea CBS 473.64]|uniref:Mid2 domain-containing protein n=1 Tax=Massarina eburnea CBS 473.64 TaxID=1395130 RepID=A0A6A6RX71_9PLEO|nr:hypothetical protein P280DRAFT_508550 [Massarina eburnea CBS 473.64]